MYLISCSTVCLEYFFIVVKIVQLLLLFNQKNKNNNIDEKHFHHKSPNNVRNVNKLFKSDSFEYD